MTKSEGSQHIYNFLKTSIPTPFTASPDDRRCMLELGNIMGLEVDEVRNYILMPHRSKDKDGKEKSTSWSIHELSKDCKVKWKASEDEDKWIESD